MSLRLTYEQVEGVFSIMPTPSTPDANRVDATFTVDLEESARGADALVRDGVDAIMINGTFGEAATLNIREWETFTRTIVEAVAGRIPVLAGPTTLNTRDTVERAKFARDAGASGLLLGRPMWNELSGPQTVRFYRDVAEAVPELGIVAYNNPAAFKNRLTPELWGQLAEIPQVVGGKYGMADDQFAACFEAARGHTRVMTIDSDWAKAVRQVGDECRACWSGSASCDPAPVLRLKDLLLTGRLDDADQLAAQLADSYDPLFPNGDVGLFRIYTIQLEKARIDAAGYLRAGLGRPPYDEIPEPYAAGAREAGLRWRRIAEETRAQTETA